MLYQINKGTKYFGADKVFEDIQFEIKSTEKIAIVGRNGCGKSTLLKCMTHEYNLDKGTIHEPAGTRIGYLAQTTLSHDEYTVEQELNQVFEPIFVLKREMEVMEEKMATDYSEELLDKYAVLQQRFEDMNGYSFQSEMMTVFTKFGFEREDLKRQVNTFSGGQRTRIAFVKLLLSKPDILLLDEPTNHLDLETIEWLEGYLKKYEKAVVLVSHDRMFLDDVVDVVYEIEYGVMKKYVGNYTSFVNQKKADIERQNRAYARQQKDIERLEELIEKFRYKKNKAAFAQSKIKYLDRMERVEKAQLADDESFHARFRAKSKSGKHVLKMDHLSIGYDHPLCEVTTEILASSRVAIMGANGTGKSTLMKTLMEQVPPLGGSFLLGHQVEVGYFDQQLAQFDSNKTVLEELWDEFPDLDRTQVRTALGQFLFSADDVFKTVNVLSGGEKVRLSFAKLLLQHANFLMLDEPTNHLDIPGKEALEDSLRDFDGTLLFVSHDRYFIKQLATSLIILNNDGSVVYYPYGYDEYMLQQKEKEAAVLEEKQAIIKETRQAQSTVRPGNIKKEVAKLEKQIEELETLLEEKRELRFDPEYYHDYQKMNVLDEEIDDVHNQINHLMEQWEELSEML